MAVCIPDFDQVRKHIKDTCQLPMEVEWGNVGLQVGNIWYCPQIPMLRMQRVSLNTLLSYVSESCFCPKDASSVKASKETAILLLFISNASYTNIEYVHIGLVVICWGYKVGGQASIVLYVSFIQNQLAPPTELPNCLMYPIRFFNDTPADLRNQLHMDLFPPGLRCWECLPLADPAGKSSQEMGDHHGQQLLSPPSRSTV